jgi:hypothetical protein
MCPLAIKAALDASQAIAGLPSQLARLGGQVLVQALWWSVPGDGLCRH